MAGKNTRKAFHQSPGEFRNCLCQVTGQIRSPTFGFISCDDLIPPKLLRCGHLPVSLDVGFPVLTARRQIELFLPPPRGPAGISSSCATEAVVKPIRNLSPFMRRLGILLNFYNQRARRCGVINYQGIRRDDPTGSLQPSLMRRAETTTLSGTEERSPKRSSNAAN
jgi:hypothetical protein